MLPKGSRFACLCICSTFNGKFRLWNMPKDPKVIDLYAGVGGLSLGVTRSGFDLIGAVEKEQRIIDSHKKNFPTSIHITSDVSTLTRKPLAAALKLGSSELAGIVGGPPCQGFSTIGRRSLEDSRNSLFAEFFRLVSEMEPAFYLAENVPGILDPKYAKIRSNAARLIERKYRSLDPIKIVAKDFGAATTRTRIFFIGVRNDVKGFDLLPEAINKMKSGNFTFVETAIAGLPLNISDKWIEYEASWRTYNSSASNPYVASLNRIIDGVGDQASINRFLNERKISCCFGTRHTKEVIQRFNLLKPGQRDEISKATRLRSDGFCPTLRAGTDSTKGSYQSVRPIHHIKPRVITPREAARLQGFPDWFQFHETKWHTFREIGNSVCPIVAEKILKAVRASLSM
jgi:DNA (cytosine-5)-methyltransferase 1